MHTINFRKTIQQRPRKRCNTTAAVKTTRTLFHDGCPHAFKNQHEIIIFCLIVNAIELKLNAPPKHIKNIGRAHVLSGEHDDSCARNN